MNAALVLAGGAGTRLGADTPKQYIKVCGRMIIDYCLETLSESSDIDAIWIVADEAWHECIEKPAKFAGFARPGKTRQLSVYSGLKCIEECIESGSGTLKFECNTPGEVNVIIHDAARPLLDADMIHRCFAALEGHDGVLPVIPVKDTVYYSENGKSVTSLMDRSRVYAGQAPEVFRLKPYMEANEELMDDAILEINGSAEPAVMAGLDIAMIEGDERNFKITTSADLDRFESVIKRLC